MSQILHYYHVEAVVRIINQRCLINSLDMAYCQIDLRNKWLPSVETPESKH